MGKRSILVWDNSKSHRTILNAPGCAILETPVNQGQDGLTKFHSMFAEFSKYPERMHACATVATPHQRERWTRGPPRTIVTDTEYSNSGNEDSFMHPLIYLKIQRRGGQPQKFTNQTSVIGVQMGARTSKRKLYQGNNLSTQSWYFTRAVRSHEGG